MPGPQRPLTAAPLMPVVAAPEPHAPLPFSWSTASNDARVGAVYAWSYQPSESST
ncbi:Uncharacterised protein [Burkholderia pseudomallei]|nr:Uncharacterised protein [Burkholderia pseudomallei]